MRTDQQVAGMLACLGLSYRGEPPGGGGGVHACPHDMGHSSELIARGMLPLACMHGA
jgi:hypothetical protein